MQPLPLRSDPCPLRDVSMQTYYDTYLCTYKSLYIFSRPFRPHPCPVSVHTHALVPAPPRRTFTHFSARLPDFNTTFCRASLSSSSSGWSCREYILYSIESLKLSRPLSTCLRVALSLDLGRPMDSRNLTAGARRQLEHVKRARRD